MKEPAPYGSAADTPAVRHGVIPHLVCDGAVQAIDFYYEAFGARPRRRASMARAVSAGATTIMPAADMFWGDRYGVVEDPFGHRWSISTPQRVMTPSEVEQAARKAMPPASAP